ncbi:hypothetical protein [Burkholderia sp. AU16741]|nr:hypothetical protein [Burkholderia sp. AU16741]
MVDDSAFGAMGARKGIGACMAGAVRGLPTTQAARFPSRRFAACGGIAGA